MGEQQLGWGNRLEGFFVPVHALSMAPDSSGPTWAVSFPLCWLCQQERTTGKGQLGWLPDVSWGALHHVRGTSTEQPCCWDGGQELGQPGWDPPFCSFCSLCSMEDDAERTSLFLKAPLCLVSSLSAS